MVVYIIVVRFKCTYCGTTITVIPCFTEYVDSIAIFGISSISIFRMGKDVVFPVDSIAIFGILSIPIFRIGKDMVFPPFEKRYFLNVNEFSGLSVTG